MRIEVDRDSVAMGDDVEPHVREVVVDAGWTLTELLSRVRPDVSVSGGSTWVCEWAGEPVAVWSSSWGTGRPWVSDLQTVADLPWSERPVLFFRYFTQVDPDWLLAQLAGGTAPTRAAVQPLWEPVRQAREDEQWRQRAADLPGRLLSRAAVRVLERLGALVEVHADAYCLLVLQGQSWRLRRTGGRVHVTRPGSPSLDLDARHVEPALLALAAESRSGGDPDAPTLAPRVDDLPVRHHWGQWQVGPDPTRPVATAGSEADALLVARAVGRRTSEVEAAYLPSSGTEGPVVVRVRRDP